MTTPSSASDYSPIPRKRRGNRRISTATGPLEAEPSLAGLEIRDSAHVRERSDVTDREDRDVWLKAQKPPHHGNS